jgi:hypothetical protein
MKIMKLTSAGSTVYGWIGGDRPSDVMEQAKARKAQGFTAVKMNAVESVSRSSLLYSTQAKSDTVSACMARLSTRA